MPGFLYRYTVGDVISLILALLANKFFVTLEFVADQSVPSPFRFHLNSNEGGDEAFGGALAGNGDEQSLRCHPSFSINLFLPFPSDPNLTFFLKFLH